MVKKCCPKLKIVLVFFKVSELADKAWKDVSSSMINSFKNAGFIKDNESIHTIHIDNYSENCPQNNWKSVTGLMKLDNMKFNDFVVDEAVTVCSQWDGNYIVAETKASCDVEEEKELIGKLPLNVTNKQILSAVDTFEVIC